MPTYTIYRPFGEIASVVICPESMIELNTPLGCSVIEGDYPATDYYVENGSPMPLMEIQVTVSGMTVTGLPVPCTAIIENVAYIVSDGEFELETSLPGPYTVTFHSPKYRAKTVVLE